MNGAPVFCATAFNAPQLSLQTNLRPILKFPYKSLSVVEMVTGKVPYQRLQHEGDVDEEWEERLPQMGSRSSRSSFRLRRIHIKKRFKFRFRFRVLSLRRLVMRRARLASAIRFSCGKFVKRMRESKAHFGDLFAGNYMFLQVSPTPLKCHDKSFSPGPIGLAPRRSFPRDSVN